LSDSFDIAVVGAGMAGASIAAELAEHASVVLLEAEDQPGYHATGRSAAFWAESYGGPLIQPLTSASGPYLAEHGFLTDRGALNIAHARDASAVERFLADFGRSGVHMVRIDREALEEIVPGLLQHWNSGVHEPECRDIDVAGLHAHYLSRARARGAELLCRFRMSDARRGKTGWLLQDEKGRQLRAGMLVNAAGAWADEVARMAGIRPLGIKPLRRTVVQIETDPPVPEGLPLVIDLGGEFYFKPEHGRLWLSPHDETPSPACDVAPEDLDVAIAIDRLQQVVDWQVKRVEHKWAGLRSFAPDRLPVYGRDEEDGQFFWFAGQGGFGIQTAPAAARLGAQLLLRQQCDTMTARIDPSLYSPARFG
jgi:D-arginine dehydrogenase